jgi:hypothetical protein
MKNMKFAVAELRTKIQANRDRHRKIFLEAQDGYRNAMIRELDKRLKEAQSGKKIARVAFFTEPEDHTRDYDRILKMLEMCSESHVELNEDEFGQYVMDDWQWKRQFLLSNSAYSVTAAALCSEEE